MAVAARSGLDRNRIGLNAVNFFLAELTGVVLPFLSDLLHDHGWHYDAIGIATCVAGLGVLLLQAPAGFVVDRTSSPRFLLAVASIVLGVAFGVLPLFTGVAAVVYGLLFLGGASQAFFAPLLGALALRLGGHERLNRTMGENQGYNHAGNLFAAASAMLVVAVAGVSSVFFSIAVVSMLAAASLLLIQREDTSRPQSPSDEAVRQDKVGFRAVLGDRRVIILLASVTLFHLANAPVMPLVALDVKWLGGSDSQVAAVVLIAQAVMVPIALLVGWLGDRVGRKPIFAVAFVALTVRIASYALTKSPSVLIALQALDGIGAGIYGVLIVSICADLTEEHGGFNSLVGIAATAQALGAVIGPLAAGFLVEHLGFAPAFLSFAAIAAVGTIVFLVFMPETRNEAPAISDGARGLRLA